METFLRSAATKTGNARYRRGHLVPGPWRSLPAPSTRWCSRDQKTHRKWERAWELPNPPNRAPIETTQATRNMKKYFLIPTIFLRPEVLLNTGELLAFGSTEHGQTKVPKYDTAQLAREIAAAAQPQHQ
eukprot:3296106-Amphidinium_carterae.1